MVTISPDIRKLVRTALAATLVAWLSGLFFLFCCGQIDARTKTKDSCPMASMAGHCDKGHNPVSSSVDADDPAGQCVDCAYLPTVFNKYRKFEKTTSELVLPAPRISIAFAPPVAKVPETILVQNRVSYEPQLLSKYCILRI